jgi:hypothetical protein
VRTYYLDASALVKRYTHEIGSEWIVAITGPTIEHAILFSEIALPEVAAAFPAKQRSPQGFTLRARDQALSSFLQDCVEHFSLLQVDREVIKRAVELTQFHRLRGYDAVHLATALIANDDLMQQSSPPVVFIAADNDLLDAAEAEGLKTCNPLDVSLTDTSPLG